MVTRVVCRALVDREAELSTLEDALLAAMRGSGSVVALAGDAGIGKSRLCDELAARAIKIGATVMVGTCSEAELAIPYLPFLEAIGNHLGVVDTKDLRARLGVHARELARVFPQLGAEPGAAMEDQDASDARLRLFEAVLALLGIAAEGRGLLLIIEDLHWADASTRELLDYVTRRLRTRNMLLLATFRSDELHRKHPLLPVVQGWQRSRLAEIVHLKPLAPDGVARMISSIFDNASIGTDFRDFIHERSEGNPFVLEEMLKAAVDRGDIYRSANEWERKPIAELRIPATVRDSVLLRLERLDPDQVAVLRRAAVLGRTFDSRTLIALAEEDRRGVESALETACAQQLLEEEAGAHGRYRFRHALTQEAIYEDLSAPARERLHSAAADVLAGMPDASIAEIAYHLRAANRWDEAVRATRQAAIAATARRGYTEAAGLYELLLPVVTAGIDRARLLCDLGEAYYMASNVIRAIEPLEEGIRLLESAGEMSESAHFRLALGRAQWERASPRRARAEYERARDVLEPAGPGRDLALAYLRLAGLHVFDLDGDGGRKYSELAIRTAEAAGAEDMKIWAYNFLGLAVGYQGDYPAAIEHLERSAREAFDRGLLEIADNALHNLILEYSESLQIGRLEDVARRLESIGTERALHTRAFALFVSTSASGDIVSALKWTEEMASISKAAGNPFLDSFSRIGYGLCLMEMDRLDEARPYFVKPDPESNLQDSSRDAVFWIQFRLASDDLAGALEGAEFLLTVPPRALPGDGIEAAIEALLAAGRRGDADRLLNWLASVTAPAARVREKIARARLCLADGDTSSATRLVSEAVTTLAAAGDLLASLRARLLTADVRVQAGDAQAAERELRTVLDAAQFRRLRLIARQARERLVKLGAEVVDAEPPTPAVAAPDEVGERLVTVMFADVRGYTALSGDRPPAEMVDKIATLQRWSSAEVERHFGIVDKFAGDAVMATFNAAGTQVDHAQDALDAALALRDKASMLGLPVGIGIATGAAMVGRLKEGANMSVLGQTTNLAARLQAQAGPGEILLSDETRRRLGGQVNAQAEQLELKGFGQPVTAFRVPAQAGRQE